MVEIALVFVGVVILVHGLAFIAARYYIPRILAETREARQAEHEPPPNSHTE